MRLVRLLWIFFAGLLASRVQADTIPTVTATSADGWWGGSDQVGLLGPNFTFGAGNSNAAIWSNSRYPCSDFSGCEAPGPVLFIVKPGGMVPAALDGVLTLDGKTWRAALLVYAQVQYDTPTVTWPAAPSQDVFSTVVPARLVGSGTICVENDVDNPSCGPNPVYLANMSVDLPIALTIYEFGATGFIQLNFTATPEPGSVGLLCAGLLGLAAVACRKRQAAGLRSPFARGCLR